MKFGANRLELECQMHRGPRAVVTEQIDRRHVGDQRRKMVLASPVAEVPIFL
jgi:hypothetical protein